MIADHATQKIIALNQARTAYEETGKTDAIEITVHIGQESKVFSYHYDPESDSLIPDEAHERA
ncbi:hypothetical protein GCM10028818_41020 [Spirosoma horti]